MPPTTAATQLTPDDTARRPAEWHRLVAREVSHLWVLAAVAFPLVLLLMHGHGCLRGEYDLGHAAGWSAVPLGPRCRYPSGVVGPSWGLTAYAVALLAWPAMVGARRRLLDADRAAD